MKKMKRVEDEKRLSEAMLNKDLFLLSSPRCAGPGQVLITETEIGANSNS